MKGNLAFGRRRSLAAIEVAALGCAALVGSPAVAEQGDASVCIAWKRGGAWVCGIGVENLECGRQWHCKTLNVTPDHPTGGCPCLAYSTKESNGCLASGETKAIAHAAPAPGTTVDFTFVPHESNWLLIADYDNITDDGQVEEYMEFRDADDFTGTFSVRFGTGPDETVPFHIVNVDLTVRPFVFRGFDTGINRVTSPLDEAAPAGFFNRRTGEVTSYRVTRCVGYNNVFPGGYRVDIRPCMKRAADGTWDVLTLATSEFNDCAGDFNRDNNRDLTDLAVLLNQFGLRSNDPGFDVNLDLDQDGAIGLGDLTQFLIRFGRQCL